MRALLDVNVLIALLDEDHEHHQAANDWLEANIQFGWASCPITQNGCIRIMSQPSYPNPCSIVDVVGKLSDATSTPHHQFIPDNVSLLNSESVTHERIKNHQQLTDIYLLVLAISNDCRFVTADRKIKTDPVEGMDPASLVTL